MIYATLAEAMAAAQEKLRWEGRPPHNDIVVFAHHKGGYEIGTWPFMRRDELGPDDHIVDLP